MTWKREKSEATGRTLHVVRTSELEVTLYRGTSERKFFWWVRLPGRRLKTGAYLLLQGNSPTMAAAKQRIESFVRWARKNAK